MKNKAVLLLFTIILFITNLVYSGGDSPVKKSSGKKSDKQMHEYLKKLDLGENSEVNIPSCNLDKFIFYASDEEKFKTYVIAAEKKGTVYKYSVVFSRDNYVVDFLKPPITGDQWVLIFVHNTMERSDEVLYAKRGEWKWTTISRDIVSNPNFSGNRLAFFTGNSGYVCDLNQKPKSVGDCFLLNRQDEKVGYPAIDKMNQNRLVYVSKGRESSFVFVDLKEVVPKYRKIELNVLTGRDSELKIKEFKRDIIFYSAKYKKGKNEKVSKPKLCFFMLKKNDGNCI